MQEKTLRHDSGGRSVANCSSLSCFIPDNAVVLASFNRRFIPFMFTESDTTTMKKKQVRNNFESKKSG